MGFGHPFSDDHSQTSWRLCQRLQAHNMLARQHLSDVLPRTRHTPTEPVKITNTNNENPTHIVFHYTCLCTSDGFQRLWHRRITCQQHPNPSLCKQGRSFFESRTAIRIMGWNMKIRVSTTLGEFHWITLWILFHINVVLRGTCALIMCQEYLWRVTGHHEASCGNDYA